MQIPFHASEGTSVGVEWELQIIDRDTRDLASAAVDIFGDFQPGSLTSTKAKYELFQSTIEVITGICSTIPEVREDLSRTVNDVAEAAKKRGLGLLSAGSHPITDWKDQKLSPFPRYKQQAVHMQWLVRQLQIFGVHVHVGIRETEKVMPIFNALHAYIPHFLALSGSSPYWVGSDTGLATSRSRIYEMVPRAGVPMQFKGWREYESYIGTLMATQTIGSTRDIWWDILPRPDFGTIEFRICDGMPTLDEVATVAALAQCLVHRFDQQLDQGHDLPTTPTWIVKENKWRASRFGLDCDLIDEHGNVAPIRQELLDLADDLLPTADALDCAKDLAGIHRILAAGASYQRQRDVADAYNGDLTAVVDSLLTEMSTGLMT